MGLWEKWKLYRGLKTFESYWKGGIVNGFDPQKTIVAGLKEILKMVAGAVTLAVIATLQDSPAVKAVFLNAGAPEAVAVFLTLAIGSGVRMFENYRKNVDRVAVTIPVETSRDRKTATEAVNDAGVGPKVGLVILALLLPALASAQDRAGCQPSAGFLQYVERGQDHQNWTARALCVADRGANTFALRGQLMRSQDASALTPQTVKSIEVFGAADRRVSGPWSVGVLGGTFFEIDSGKSLRDPRQWTVAGYVKYRIAKGYILAGYGHSAPVGGQGFVAVAEIPKGDHASFVVDASAPSSRGRFRENPFIIRSGVLLRK